MCSCLVAAGQAAGRDVVTVEGLAGVDAADLHPVQDGVRRGRRGAVRLLHAGADRGRATTCCRRIPLPTDAEIREALAGNLCRCTGYEMILDAVRMAAGACQAGGDDEPAMTETTTIAPLQTPTRRGRRRRP